MGKLWKERKKKTIFVYLFILLFRSVYMDLILFALCHILVSIFVIQVIPQHELRGSSSSLRSIYFLFLFVGSAF